MPNQSLVDLTERTATADTDLIHVNSGGSDYKQTKENFLRGNLALEFSNSSLLTAQVDALPVDATYFGYLWNYGHTTETGMPINGLSYINVKKSPNAQYSVIEAWSAYSPEGEHYICGKSSGTWGSWTKVPTRSEITALNNSLANSSLKFADHSFTNITIASTGYAKLGSIPTDFGVSISNFFVGFIVRGWSGGNGGAISVVLGSNGTDVYILGTPNSIVQNINVRLWYVNSVSN